MDQWNNEVNGLFATYRTAIPDPEASANFMPELWRKIEARRNFGLRIRRLTQMFLAAAAALSIIFVTILSVPEFTRADAQGSYIEVLADAYPTEGLASHGIIPHEDAEGK